jgi:nucleoid-associated protein YgaU
MVRADSSIRRAEHIFANTRPFQTDADTRNDYEALIEERNRLNEDVNRLKQEKAALQQRIASLERDLKRTPPATRPKVPAASVLPPIADKPAVPPPSENAATKKIPRTYRVKSGDNLSKISKKVYGTPARWEDIYELNKDKLKNPKTNLQIGWELRLP